MIIALIGCGFIPLAISLAHLSFPKAITALERMVSAPLFFKSNVRMESYFSFKASTHSFVAF